MITENAEYNSVPGFEIPEKYTISFGRFASDAFDNLMLLRYIQILDHSQDTAIKKVHEMAANPENIELHAFDNVFLNTVSTKIFDSKSYERVLSQMTFCRFIDSFLSYLKEIIVEVVKIVPGSFLPLTEDNDNIPKEPGLPDIEKTLRKLFYMNFPDIVSFFKNKLGIELQENDIKTFTIFVKERNLIVHNRATVSDELISSAPELAPFKGKHMHFDYQQLEAMLQFLYKIAMQVDGLVADKYELSLLGQQPVKK